MAGGGGGETKEEEKRNKKVRGARKERWKGQEKRKQRAVGITRRDE